MINFWVYFVNFLIELLPIFGIVFFCIGTACEKNTKISAYARILIFGIQLQIKVQMNCLTLGLIF